MNSGAQIAGRALIGAGRIGEPVADDPGAAPERRQDRLFEMVDPGGAEQKRLAPGAEAGGEAGKDRLAQSLGAGRSARLTGADDFEPVPGEARLEPRRLDRLAHALPAFESDKTARGQPGHLARPMRRGFRFNSHASRRRNRAPPFAQASASSAANDRPSQHGSAPFGNARKWDRIAGALGSKSNRLDRCRP